MMMESNLRAYTRCMQLFHGSQGVEVVVSAPDVNQSGSSQSSIGSITVDNFEQDGRFFGYAVHGRPADAVRFGIKELGKDQPFDIVVSGINRGANVGNVSHLSGTVGAAMEGLYHGLPAIAVSEDPNSENTAITAKFTCRSSRSISQAWRAEWHDDFYQCPSRRAEGSSRKTNGRFLPEHCFVMIRL